MDLERSFDEAHDAWFRTHLRESAGDRRLQLERRAAKESADGEECAEKRFLRDVWWPVYGELESLVPEYEVIDGLGKTRFLDHAFVRYPVLVDIEIDGYGTHQKDASRWTFADDRRRDAGLRMIGWDVLRFAFSDVREHPLACQQVLRRWMEAIKPRISQKQEWVEHVVRLSIYNSPFSLVDVMELLRISEHPARRLLKELVLNQIILPAGSGEQRVRTYQKNENYLRGRKAQPIRF